MKNKEQVTVTKENIIDFQERIAEAKAQLGGKAPISENWLRELTPGTSFLLRPRRQDRLDLNSVGLMLYVIVAHTDVGTMLADVQQKEKPPFMVDTQRFSLMFEWRETLEEGTGPKDDDNSGADKPGEVGPDA